MKSLDEALDELIQNAERTNMKTSENDAGELDNLYHWQLTSETLGRFNFFKYGGKSYSCDINIFVLRPF